LISNVNADRAGWRVMGMFACQGKSLSVST
jgi:hypothetical protein